jgi:hypothetical protein
VEAGVESGATDNRSRNHRSRNFFFQEFLSVFLIKLRVMIAMVVIASCILIELEMRSPLALATSLKCPARIYVGTQEPQFQKTNLLTAKLAKENVVDAEAILVEGDYESSVLPGIKQSRFLSEKVTAHENK